MSGLSELITKLEGLSGPDSRVDEMIWEAIGGWPEREYRSVNYMKAFGTPVTASLDAAVALVERKLPGWGYYLRSDKEGHGCGLVYPDAFRVTPCHCMGATPAIAVCLALLRSLEGRDE